LLINIIYISLIHTAHFGFNITQSLQKRQTMKKSINCKNCNTKFEGNFCTNCGEKVIKEGDFALTKILSQGLDSFTHLDSKLFKTLKLILFYPGKLSKLNIEGIKVPYMKPFQIFIILNVIFFILFANDDIFRVPSNYFFQESYEGIPILEKVRSISQETGLSESEIAILYDNKSINLMKLLLVLLIPIIALIGKLFNNSKKMEFGKHLVFAIPFLTFFLALFVIGGLFLGLTSSPPIKKMILISIGLSLFIHYSLSIKNFYANSISVAFIKGIVATVLILFAISVYKLLISVLALYSL